MFPNQRWNENWRGKPDRLGTVVGKPEAIDGPCGQEKSPTVAVDAVSVWLVGTELQIDYGLDDYAA
jgi:hypothetical protein